MEMIPLLAESSSSKSNKAFSRLFVTFGTFVSVLGTSRNTVGLHHRYSRPHPRVMKTEPSWSTYFRLSHSIILRSVLLLFDVNMMDYGWESWSWIWIETWRSHACQIKVLALDKCWLEVQFRVSGLEDREVQGNNQIWNCKTATVPFAVFVWWRCIATDVVHFSSGKTEAWSFETYGWGQGCSKINFLTFISGRFTRFYVFLNVVRRCIVNLKFNFFWLCLSCRIQLLPLQGKLLAVCSAATKSSVILCLENLIGMVFYLQKVIKPDYFVLFTGPASWFLLLSESF